MSRVARLGAFIVLTLLILALGVFVIGSQQYLFHSTYRLQTQFDNVTGLSAGADVQVGGVHSGTVRSILLPRRPGEKVTVVMDVANATRDIVKQDSIASIQTEGLIGNQFIAISFGTPGQPDIHDGDTLQSQPPLQIGDLLKKANGLLDGSQAAIDNTTKMTAHLSAVSAKIDSGQGTVGALVNDRQLYSNLQDSTSSLRGTMTQAQAGVTSFKENMDAMKQNFLLRGYFKKRGYEDSTELTANQISGLPNGSPVMTFNYSGKQLFDSRDSAKLKNGSGLNKSGDYLANNSFGIAVIVVSSGMEGDSQKQQVLTEARAALVRKYLVEHFGFDDSKVKTIGMGKQSGANLDADWGSVQVLIYPEGTEQPAASKPLSKSNSKAAPPEPKQPDPQKPEQASATDSN